MYEMFMKITKRSREEDEERYEKLGFDGVLLDLVI